MLPNGEYQLSQTQAAKSVGLPERNAREFLNSKALKTLLGDDYTPATSEIESAEGKRGQSRIRGLSLEVVSAYWLWQAYRGNKQALMLCMGLIAESLERRFDAAFGINRTESQYNDRLTQRMQQLERNLQRLGDAYALDDDLRAQVAYLERFCRDHGLDPWGTPGQTDSL